MAKPASPSPKPPGHEQWSPRTRGWSWLAAMTTQSVTVVPAHAGVVPARRACCACRRSGPRARGGGPSAIDWVIIGGEWSPRTRGWSRGAPPDVDRLWSPRTRGWSLQARLRRRGVQVVPAHAGVVPHPRHAPDAHRQWSPRTRGWSLADVVDAALPVVVPAHAGVVPSSPANTGRPGSGPRARGGGPYPVNAPAAMDEWSPRTRGWSRRRVHRLQHRRVVPAHAGVVPSTTQRRSSRKGGPRARGGGPTASIMSRWRAWWSPRTRGWSLPSLPQRGGGAVVPAHAGVVPGRRGGRGLARSGPRARGGGPPHQMKAAPGTVWSPRTRGWSHQGVAVSTRALVVPAHAGVVPRGRCRARRRPGGPRARGGGPR